MDRDQARKVYKTVRRLFPYFHRDADDDTIILWLDLLEKGDYEKTKRKLIDYSTESSYDPKIADILVKEYKPINTEVTDVAAMEKAVREEMADPERRERRQEKLKQFENKIKELRRHGR